MTELDYKLQFAGLLQRVPRELRLNPQPMIAKQIVGTEDCMKYPLFVLHIAETWPVDPVVIAEIDRLDKTPIEKEIILTELHRIGTSVLVDPADRVKAFAEYAKISGWTMPSKNDLLRSDDRLKELAAMVLNEDEIGKLEGVV
jgi:hypothetical protein